ncbi:MAG: hypothetical protein HY876_10365 [Coriobacteriales bacterium]|nr:hypothetical protein [Coriobacteriales bacterium]
MLGAFLPPYRAGTVVLLALAVALAAVAVFIGIDENPPGIALAALAGAVFVTGLVHHWRAPRRFLVLAAASVGTVLVLGIVGIGIDISVTSHFLRGPAASALEAVRETLVLTLAFVGLPAILVGLLGALIAWVVSVLGGSR